MTNLIFFSKLKTKSEFVDNQDRTKNKANKFESHFNKLQRYYNLKRFHLLVQLTSFTRQNLQNYAFTTRPSCYTKIS